MHPTIGASSLLLSRATQRGRLLYPTLFVFASRSSSPASATTFEAHA